MNTKFERIAIGAAAVAAVVSLAVASPSFASQNIKAQSSSSSVSDSVRDHDVDHVHATVVASITGIPATVTDAKSASRGATFVAYKLDASATALPATQPTTGGKKLKIDLATAKLDATTGTLSGNLKLDAGLAGSVTKYAIYSSTGVASYVVVTATAADATTGIYTATASSSVALTATYAAPTAPALGEGKGIKGDRGEKNGRTHGRGRH